MKKAISAIVSAVIVLLAIISNGYAQKSGGPQFGTAFYPEIIRPVAAENLAASNAKALRKFKKEFRNAGNESWYELKDGHRVKFTQDGIYNMADYNAGGNWVRTIRYYSEKELPASIRNAVKSQFLDYRIFLVMELNLQQSRIYLVKIEDEKSWKTIRVTEDEMDIVEEYTK